MAFIQPRPRLRLAPAHSRFAQPWLRSYAYLLGYSHPFQRDVISPLMIARFSGSLSNGSGDPISNAVIVLCNSDADLWFLTSTDAEGFFDLSELPANRFAIEVLSPQWRRASAIPGRGQVWGYSPWSDTLVLAAGQTLQRNIQLGGLTLQPRSRQTSPPCTPRRPFLTLNAGNLAMLLIDGPTPVYPTGVTVSNGESDVNLEAFINQDGKVISLRLIGPTWPPKVDPALTKAAVNAVRNWRYNRPLVNFSPEPLEFGGPILVDFSNR
jgi:Carboxypeptidase regulatory-like domain